MTISVGPGVFDVSGLMIPSYLKTAEGLFYPKSRIDVSPQVKIIFKCLSGFGLKFIYPKSYLCSWVKSTRDRLTLEENGYNL